jgi:hypothetical protein
MTIAWSIQTELLPYLPDAGCLGQVKNGDVMLELFAYAALLLIGMPALLLLMGKMVSGFFKKPRGSLPITNRDIDPSARR